MLALYFAKKNKKVVLLEKEEEILTKASYNNQARIHNGYHYPRHFITALRSHINYKKFNKDFKKAVYDNFRQYYAIASISSKTNARQFVKFCEHIGSPIKPVSKIVKSYFNLRLVEDVFEVEEKVFDVGIMRKILNEALKINKVEVFCGERIFRVQKYNDKVICDGKNGKTFIARKVFNCAYSQINNILVNSDLPLLPFKQEFIEMPLLKVPDELRDMAVTVLDGPFFGFLPFPDTKTHSLWHVRYAILANWIDPAPLNIELQLKKLSMKSNYHFMLKDAQRYIPLLKDSEYIKSVYETKTTLLEKEENDGRPILYKKDYGIKGLNIIMGGKIDNIYDIIYEIDKSD